MWPWRTGSSVFCSVPACLSVEAHTHLWLSLHLIYNLWLWYPETLLSSILCWCDFCPFPLTTRQRYNRLNKWSGTPLPLSPAGASWESDDIIYARYIRLQCIACQVFTRVLAGFLSAASDLVRCLDFRGMWSLCFWKNNVCLWGNRDSKVSGQPQPWGYTKLVFFLHKAGTQSSFNEHKRKTYLI